MTFLMLGNSSIKWRQHPNLTIVDDWDTKPQIEQTDIPAMPLIVCAKEKEIFLHIQKSLHRSAAWQLKLMI